MRQKWVVSVICIAFLVSLLGFGNISQAEGQVEIKGSLLIVGGALDTNNAEVYNKFIELAQKNQNKSKADIRIGIMPTGSADPIWSAESYKDDFVSYGVPRENMFTIPIAVKDDSDTKDVDESKWGVNAQSEEIADQVRSYDAIWFVGGDQSRYTAVLYNADGSQTPVLKAVWEIYRNGAVLGGSSAGAAIMSEPMLSGGTSMGALSGGAIYKEDGSDDRVFITRGFGFFDVGIVDQHFLKRGRLGRLIVAQVDQKKELGFGIDENSAMVVNNQEKSIEVIGTSGMLVVDTKNVVHDPKHKGSSIKNVKISYLEKTDKFFWETKTFALHPKKTTTKGIEYYDPEPTHTSIFSSDAIKTVITDSLIDNTAKDAQGMAFVMKNKNNGEGFMLTFRKGADTEGFWGRINGVGSYAALNVYLDIEPIKLEIKYGK